MHYKNGREAKLGDKILGIDINGNPVGGMLTDAAPGSETCNGAVISTQAIGQNQTTVTLADCLHVDDAFTAEKPEGD